jgi:hypothetical protein
MNTSLLLLQGLMLSVALFLRVLPHRFAKGSLSVDHWFWRSYIETYRRDRRFPPTLPQYLLDEHQWYPPLFPLLMAVFPAALFARSGFWVSVGIDLLRMAVLLGTTAWLTSGDIYAVVVAGLIYATSPILISYNTQLNPRGLGALFLDGAVLLVIGQLQFDGPVWLWGLALGLTALILLTHKMTTQLLWFLCLASGLILQDWRLLALIPGSILTALILSKGFYWRVMQAHWDIVKFWHRNWRWLQAHPIKESPIYGTSGYETPTKFHQKGLAGVLRHFRYLLGFNLAAWLILAVSITTAGPAPIVTVVSGILLWLQLTLLFCVLTVFVPSLKCLGSGYYYLYNAAFPVALQAGILSTGSTASGLLWGTFIGAVVANLIALAFYYRKLRANIQGPESQFEDVIEFLKEKPHGAVLCFPLQLSERVAYQTRHPVVWGAHGYGFQRVEPIFPRLLLPIREVLQRYRVKYLVAQEGYLTPAFLAELPYESVVKFGNFQVFLTKP